MDFKDRQPGSLAGVDLTSFKDPASIHKHPLFLGSAPMVGAVRVWLSESLPWYIQDAYLSYRSVAVKKHCNYGNSPF